MTQGGEEAAEMISTIRGEHVAMKTWFNGTNPTAVALRSKWGDYPGLWKEVLNWKGWKEARKAYLADQQRNEMLSNSNAAGNGTANTSTTSPGTQIPIKMENSTPNDNSRTTSDGDAAVPRRTQVSLGKCCIRRTATQVSLGNSCRATCWIYNSVERYWQCCCVGSTAVVAITKSAKFTRFTRNASQSHATAAARNGKISSAFA
jgi:hypothetical protein